MKALGALLVAAGLAAGPGAAIAAAPPSRLLATATEFRLGLSRTRLRPGPAVIQLANRGQDGHDLVVQRVGGREVGALPETAAGELGTLRVALRPGRYVLFCSLPGHRAQGMQARLTVSGRR